VGVNRKSSGSRLALSHGKPTASVDATEREPSVALHAVPAQHSGFERLAAHRLHRVAEERFDFPDGDRREHG
jgi:hypothetical protein